MTNKNTSWGNVAKWYNDLIQDEDSYQQKVIRPNLLRLLDPKKGEKILDIGCGQGIFSNIVGESGAEVSGVDISPELIEIAKRNAKVKNISFTVASADERFPFEDNSFQKVFCVLALQNIKNAENFFKESKRVLKEGGKIFLVLNHPAFRVPKGSDWGFEETKDKYNGNQYRKIYEYMSEKKVEIDMHPGESEKGKKGKLTYSFHRPLQLYFKYFAKNNFAVTRLEEWISHKESQKGPRKNAEDKARKEIPIFMMIEATKLVA